MRGEASDITGRPGEIRRLIYRSEVADALRLRREVLRHGVAIISKSLRKRFRKNINILRIPVMKQVPNDVDAVSSARCNKGVDRAEIITAPSIHQRPAHRLARGENADFLKASIILVRMLVMVRCGNLVDPLPPGIVAGGALESGKEKATKHVPSFLQ